MGKRRNLFYGIVCYLCLQGCIQTKHEIDVAPVEIKPIHITIDVNVKVDKALDDFFGDLDKIENKTGTDTVNTK
ncbi:MAG: hypothetical protein JETT_0938 [Candidatus Jettenia ecosi]|uniref:Uncharacterized protein n=1 Tax=Candidatus Jettenia ecosi TaxID=2494326 RepID=A0A533QD71_9BACT|nr:MAG: hypothetical protein JETT_0938 [Candidatus Jettenia ecosi]